MRRRVAANSLSFLGAWQRFASACRKRSTCYVRRSTRRRWRRAWLSASTWRTGALPCGLQPDWWQSSSSCPVSRHRWPILRRMDADNRRPGFGARGGASTTNAGCGPSFVADQRNGRSGGASGQIARALPGSNGRCVGPFGNPSRRNADVSASRQSRKRRRAFDSVHDAWLAALKSADAAVDGEPRELKSLAEQIARWRRPVAVSSTTPLRLCFRLEEPESSDAAADSSVRHRQPKNGDGSHSWQVRYLLQARTIPACSYRSRICGIHAAGRPRLRSHQAATLRNTYCQR